MAKLLTNNMLDGGINATILNTNLTICAGQPISFADIAAKALATHVLTGGDWTKADGDVNGRKATLAQQANISITTSGTADHVVTDDGVDDYIVTTCTSQVLTAGGTVTVPAFDQEYADPV